jgi:adenylylsulfate kinase
VLPTGIPSSQRQWQDRFQQLDDVIVVYLTADLETCLERNRRRDEPIEERAAHIIWCEFHEPDADVTIDVRDRSPAAVVDRILDVVASRPGDCRLTAPDPGQEPR